MDHFIDSSALVKRYAEEAGSLWIRGLFSAASLRDVFIVSVTCVEIVAALTRRARGGSLSVAEAITLCSLFQTHLQSAYQVVEVTETLLQQAMALAQTHGLRGYDALQLAAGIQVNRTLTRSGLPPLIFVSADLELNAAARSEGLLVEDPNRHP